MTITLELLLCGATDEEVKLAELDRVDSPAVLDTKMPVLEEDDLELETL